MPQSSLSLRVKMLALAAFWTAGALLGTSAQEELATQQPSDPEPMPREHHAWARFPVGAWREIHIVEQTFGDEQQVTGRSEIVRTERLEEVTPQQYTLEQTVRIELGPDRILSPPITVTLGLHTDEPGNLQSLTFAPAEAVSLGGRDIQTQVWNVATGGEAHTVLTRLWYSPDEPPYLLRSISEAVIPATHEPVWRRTKKALARELPFPWRDRQFSVTFWEEQHLSTKGTRHSIIVTAEEVPGGVVARWTKEMNLEGRLIRQEVQTLGQWGLEGDVKDE